MASPRLHGEEASNRLLSIVCEALETLLRKSMRYRFFSHQSQHILKTLPFDSINILTAAGRLWVVIWAVAVIGVKVLLQIDAELFPQWFQLLQVFLVLLDVLNFGLDT